MKRLIATATLTFGCLCSASAVTSPKADPAIYRVTLAHVEADFCKAPPITAEDKASLIRAAAAITVPGLVFDHVFTPMDYAVIADDVPSVVRLVGIGYPLTSRSLSTGGSLLHLAAWSDSRNVALFLLQQGADPNDSSGTGATPLMVAAMEGRRHMVELLLEHGAEVNAHSPDRVHTALSYSMICRDQALVDLLLGAGAEVDPHAKMLADKFGISVRRDEP